MFVDTDGQLHKPIMYAIYNAYVDTYVDMSVYRLLYM